VAQGRVNDSQQITAAQRAQAGTSRHGQGSGTRATPYLFPSSDDAVSSTHSHRNLLAPTHPPPPSCAQPPARASAFRHLRSTFPATVGFLYSRLPGNARAPMERMERTKKSNRMK
jgi:hypothetical protein